MLRRLYEWVKGLAASRQAPWALFIVSFAESSFFPIPPDVMLAPMIMTRPERAYVYAGICTGASVLGGMLGYAIGYYLAPVGHAILAIVGHSDGEAAFRAWFAQWGVWVILIKGLTPIPYKLVTITSGLAHFSLPVFIGASIVTRGARFFIEAWLLKRWGPQILEQVEKRLALTTFIVLAVIIGGIVAVRFLG